MVPKAQSFISDLLRQLARQVSGLVLTKTLYALVLLSHWYINLHPQELLSTGAPSSRN